MAVGSRFFLRDFDGGQTLSNRQEFRLGTIGQDEIGQEWSYVRFRGEETVSGAAATDNRYTTGQWVCDQFFNIPHANVVQGASLQGGNKLEVGDSWFQSRTRSVGAIGKVSGTGGAGANGFVVTDWYDTGEVRVRVISNNTDIVTDRGAGWSANFNDNGIDYYLPGDLLPQQNFNANNRIRGIVQCDVTNADLRRGNRFGWVLQKGVGVCLVSNAVANTGIPLHPGNGGNLTNATTNQPELARALVQKPAAAGLVLAEINIENNAQALGGPRPLTGVGMRGEVIR